MRVTAAVSLLADTLMALHSTPCLLRQISQERADFSWQNEKSRRILSSLGALNLERGSASSLFAPCPIEIFRYRQQVDCLQKPPRAQLPLIAQAVFVQSWLICGRCTK
jgi:hypothetical protein